MESPSQSPFKSPSGSSALPWGGKDTALVIEDNEAVAGLLKILLAKSALQVIWCQTGAEALEKFRERHDAIAIVLSDCRLPDGDGREFCHQMRVKQPDLPLLLSSGSAACLNLGPLKSAKLVRLMPKPYTPAEMLFHVGKLQEEAKAALVAISAGFV